MVPASRSAVLSPSTLPMNAFARMAHQQRAAELVKLASSRPAASDCAGASCRSRCPGRGDALRVDAGGQQRVAALRQDSVHFGRPRRRTADRPASFAACPACASHTRRPPVSTATASICRVAGQPGDVVDDLGARPPRPRARRPPSTCRSTSARRILPCQRFDHRHHAAQFLGSVDRLGSTGACSRRRCRGCRPLRRPVRRPCSMAAWVDENCPPSEKLSGVTLTMPISSGRRENCSVCVRSRQRVARRG